MLGMTGLPLAACNISCRFEMSVVASLTDRFRTGPPNLQISVLPGVTPG